MATKTLYCTQCGMQFDNSYMSSCPRCGCPRDGKPYTATCPGCGKQVYLDQASGFYHCYRCEMTINDPIFETNGQTFGDDPLGLRESNHQAQRTTGNKDYIRDAAVSSSEVKPVIKTDRFTSKPVKNTSGDLPICPACHQTRLVWAKTPDPAWVWIVFIIGVITIGFFGWLLWGIAIFYWWFIPKPLKPHCPMCEQFFQVEQNK